MLHLSGLSSCQLTLYRPKFSVRVPGVHIRVSSSRACAVQIMGELADERADCYSFGVLLHEICSQDMPDRGRLRPISVPDEAPQVVVDLMWRCMNTHPDDRPSARQCVEVLAAAQ